MPATLIDKRLHVRIRVGLCLRGSYLPCHLARILVMAWILLQVDKLRISCGALGLGQPVKPVL